MDSEAALDDAIKSLSVLGETQLLPLFVAFGSVETLVSLLTHSNSDIADSVVKVVGELIDIDNTADEGDIKQLVRELLETNEYGPALKEYLDAREEADELDTEGVADALRTLENINTLGRDVTVLAFDTKSKLLQWLLKSLVSDKAPSTVKNTSAELLASILVSTPALANHIMTGVDGIDILLQAIAPVRKGVRKGSDEEGYFQDLLDTLVRSLRTSEAVASFVENEGVELMFLLIAASAASSSLGWLKRDAYRALVEALKGPSGGLTAARIAETPDVKKAIVAKIANSSKSTVDDVLQLLAYLFRWLPLGSWARKKMVTRVAEKKLDVLLDLRDSANKAVEKAKAQVAQSQTADDEEEDDEDAELRRYALELEQEELLLKAGKERLRNVDIILAWFSLEYPQLKQLTSDHFKGPLPLNVIQDYRRDLQTYLDSGDGSELDEEFERAEATLTLEMLDSLLDGLAN